MNFLSAYFLAFASAGVIAALAVPLWRAWCHQVGLVDEPGHRKIHAEPIALAGGLAVLTGLLLPLVVGAATLKLGLFTPSTVESLRHGLSRRGFQTGVLFAGAVAMVVLGWLDDKYELRPVWVSSSSGGGAFPNGTTFSFGRSSRS